MTTRKVSKKDKQQIHSIPVRKVNISLKTYYFSHQYAKFGNLINLLKFVNEIFITDFV